MGKEKLVLWKELYPNKLLCGCRCVVYGSTKESVDVEGGRVETLLPSTPRLFSVGHILKN